MQEEEIEHLAQNSSKEVKKKDQAKSKRKKKKVVKPDYNPPFGEKIIAVILLIATILISFILMKIAQ